MRSYFRVAILAAFVLSMAGCSPSKPQNVDMAHFAENEPIFEQAVPEVHFIGIPVPRSPFHEIFIAAADEYALDVQLLQAIAEVESEFEADAVSSAGAQGVMQLMPSTAKDLGVEDPFDPKVNIDAGARLISQLLEDYEGDVQFALAAYNAGPSAVNKYGGVPPYPETQQYVAKVLSQWEENKIALDFPYLVAGDARKGGVYGRTTYSNAD